MGTNYYLMKEKCKCCGRSDEPLHIGKSSAGWHFALHVDPAIGINNLDDWKALWVVDGSVIENEYGDVITAEEMNDIITNRGDDSLVANWDRIPYGYNSWTEFHVMNDSEQGLKGLLASRYKARRTDGTYDLVSGEFS